MYWYGFWWLFPERRGRRVKCYTRYLVTQNEGSWSCPLPEAEPEAITEAREARGAGEGGSIPTPASPYTGHYTHWFTFPQSTNTTSTMLTFSRHIHTFEHLWFFSLSTFTQPRSPVAASFSHVLALTIIKKSTGQKTRIQFLCLSQCPWPYRPQSWHCGEDGKRRYHHFNAPLFVTEHFVSFAILNTIMWSCQLSRR